MKLNNNYLNKIIKFKNFKLKSINNSKQMNNLREIQFQMKKKPSL